MACMVFAMESVTVLPESVKLLSKSTDVWMNETTK